jgi:hypothetical protein
VRVLTDRALRNVVVKHPWTGLEPNMVDYDEARARFSWTAARAELAGLPGGA